MKLRLLSSLASIAMVASVANAQTMAPHPSEHAAANPAIKDPKVAWAALAKGSNSFTKAQAQDRLAEAGYKKIAGLTKDKDGLWQATALWEGKKRHVGLDYKGNIASR